MTTEKLTRKDFVSQVDPRWCLGCGCYSIFNKITSIFPTVGIPREKFAVISGIGCSSRFPYYVSTYGFHTLHGRAPAVAMGLKLARPDLSVWITTGDGDALSIGGNHFIHLMRRNPDIKVILFNNQIYGLTKGQASPTTAVGKKTKSTPYGAVDLPIHPLSLAIAAGATFAARVTDVDGEMMTEVLAGAAAHRGIAFIEIMMNCVIFNDGAFTMLTDKASRPETNIKIKHGEKIIFGSERNKGIKFNGMTPEIVEIGKNGVTLDQIAVHDIHSKDSALAYSLSLLDDPSKPVPLGIFRQVEAPVYSDYFSTNLPSPDELDKLMSGGEAWKQNEAGEIRSG